jgi:hypothetical protein
MSHRSSWLRRLGGSAMISSSIRASVLLGSLIIARGLLMSPFVMFTFKLQPPWVGVNVLPAELYPERIRKKSVAVCVLWVKPPEVSGLPEVRCQKTA